MIVIAKNCMQQIQPQAGCGGDGPGIPAFARWKQEGLEFQTNLHTEI